MKAIQELVRAERDRLCIAYAYAYVEQATQTGRELGRKAEALVIQPYKKTFFPSAAEVAATYARLQGSAIPILFSPQHRSEEQFLTHIGRLLWVADATAPGVADDVRRGVQEKRYVLQSEGEDIYSEGSFLFVHPRIEPLRSRAALAVLQNALGAGKGATTGALHIPAPKLLDPKFRHILDEAPETWAPVEGSVAENRSQAPCGKCRTSMPRDSLRALNPQWWDENNIKTRIRLRLCDPCLNEVITDLRAMEWDPSEETSLG